MADDLRITTNLPLVQRDLVRFEDQVPFAMSTALNAVMDLAARAQTQGMLERFHVRKPERMRTAVRTKKSNKATLEAELVIRDPHLVQHEEGEVRMPGDIRSSLVQPESPEAVRVGVLRGRNTPKWYLERLKQKPRPFVQTMKSGKKGVFVRAKAGPDSRYPIELIFAFERRAKLHRVLKFGATVGSVANVAWEKEFGRALGQAIRTAR